jgi:hypothetical protein
MRKETSDIMYAFLDRANLVRQRTYTDGRVVFLHGSPIIERGTGANEGTYALTMYGHDTQTTKERLNGFLEIIWGKRPFFTRAGKTYFGSLLREVDRDEVMILPAKRPEDVE